MLGNKSAYQIQSNYMTHNLFFWVDMLYAKLSRYLLSNWSTGWLRRIPKAVCRILIICLHITIVTISCFSTFLMFSQSFIFNFCIILNDFFLCLFILLFFFGMYIYYKCVTSKKKKVMYLVNKHRRKIVHI